MKKEDQFQQNKNFNKDYFGENQEMLKAKSYQQEYRQDKLTTTDNIKQELYSINKKNYDNEQTKIRMEQETKAEEERIEREEFENWKKEKKLADDNK